jgi:lipopolysaccharide transport system permease protein
MQVGVSFLGRVALLVTVFLIFALEPAPTAPLFLLGILSVAMTGFMIGLIVTPIGLLYGDVSHALPIATTFLMLLTPVLYPPPSTGVAAMIAAVNPLTPLITTTRDWLTVGTAPEAGSFAVITLVTATFLMLGWIVYRVALPHLIARLGN